MFNFLKGFGLVGMVIAVIALVILSPLLIIWGLNTLFPVLAIPYSLETWAAVIAVRLALQTTVSVNK